MPQPTLPLPQSHVVVHAFQGDTRSSYPGLFHKGRFPQAQKPLQNLEDTVVREHLRDAFFGFAPGVCIAYCIVATLLLCEG